MRKIAALFLFVVVGYCGFSENLAFFPSAAAPTYGIPVTVLFGASMTNTSQNYTEAGQSKAFSSTSLGIGESVSWGKDAKLVESLLFSLAPLSQTYGTLDMTGLDYMMNMSMDVVVGLGYTIRFLGDIEATLSGGLHIGEMALITNYSSASDFTMTTVTYGVGINPSVSWKIANGLSLSVLAMVAYDLGALDMGYSTTNRTYQNGGISLGAIAGLSIAF